MTKEEKQKAIDALKMSAPVMTVTQEEFSDYIWTLNKIMDWLEQEPCSDAVSRQAVLAEIFKKPAWHNSDGSYYHADDIRDAVNSVKPKTGQWIMRHRKVNTINYRTGEDVLTGEIHTVKELIRYETDEPYCACCGKRAEDISQDYCGYCGARMIEPQESEGV